MVEPAMRGHVRMRVYVRSRMRSPVGEMSPARIVARHHRQHDFVEAAQLAAADGPGERLRHVAFEPALGDHAEVLRVDRIGARLAGSEEFEAAKEMAAKAREENDRLSARLAALEKRLGDPAGGPSNGGGG